MSNEPIWLQAMRAATGVAEVEGSGSNPKILAMRDYVARKFPEQADYAALYTDDSVAWCGLCCAWAMAVADISGPFGPTDTDRWMWALAWSEDPNYQRLDAPRLGCVLVKEREGGGHVCMYEGTEGDTYLCRGGNQSDAVTLANYPISDFVGAFWPRAGGPIPPAERRTVAEGDSGEDVASVQRSLGLPADGDFGPATESGVKGFQGAVGLAKDGVVGNQTWDAIDQLDARVAAGNDGISVQLAEAIDRLVADNSDVQGISWPDRSRPPPGYYSGMAKTFALAVARYNAGDPAAIIMAEAAGDADEDALAHYEAEFEDEGMSNDKAGLDTLRHLFVLMFGLGMRETSGDCWEGRDMSADNVQSDTCEAGLFQTSWNASNCVNGEIDDLLAEYWNDPNGFGETFRRGLSPSASQLDCYGSGDGARYQWLARFSPAFAALMTAVGLRRLKDHWGPIIRHEVDIMPEIDDMLIEVQRQMDLEPMPPEPGPEPDEATVTITATTQGNVTVDMVENEGPPAGPAKVTVGVKSKGDVIVDVQENVPSRPGQRR
jgi:uncharacterized protein (TIGR02594 family)